MKYDYDLITIGLGPAGMAVSVIAAEMRLKLCAIEQLYVPNLISTENLYPFGHINQTFDSTVWLFSM